MMLTDEELVGQQLLNALSFAREDARPEGKLDDTTYVMELAEKYAKFLLNVKRK